MRKDDEGSLPEHRRKALVASIEMHRWQLEHVRQGLREADAGRFVSAAKVKQVQDRLKGK